MTAGAELEPGVGARQGSAAASSSGGGYLDICNRYRVPIARQLEHDELRHLGLSPMWLEVSRAVGPEAFVQIWEILDRHATEDYGNLRLRIPRFRRFLRHQRNRFLLTLARAGLGADEIRERLKEEVDESLHVEHVRKLIQRLNNDT